MIATSNNTSSIIIESSEVIKPQTNNFIEANTKKVSLKHLMNDCIVPVFSKDNEMTISHYQFVNSVFSLIQARFENIVEQDMDIRVSHEIKGRIPSAIGKPVKELVEGERTLYYERCAFVINIPQIKREINGNELCLTIGGVRSLAQENLYGKKSLEKFKLFIGFQNKVCLNLCVSTDGFCNNIKIGNLFGLEEKIETLVSNYNIDIHFTHLRRLLEIKLTEKQFAHFIGKAKMYQHLGNNERNGIFPIAVNDSQISHLVKQYYTSDNFGCNSKGEINLWDFYNLITEANKSSYIGNNIDRNVKAFGLVSNMWDSFQNQSPNYFLN